MFSGSHCGKLSFGFPLRPSVQVRDALLVRRETGLAFAPVPFAVTPATYLFALTLMAVLPSPRRSYAKPMRGVTSFQLRFLYPQSAGVVAQFCSVARGELPLPPFAFDSATSAVAGCSS